MTKAHEDKLMSDMTVQSFAKVVGIPLDRLLVQLKEAGISVASAEIVITEEQKLTLLDYLRKRHGNTEENTVGLPKRVTLKRKTITKLSQGQISGKMAKTIKIETRKQKTYIRRRGDMTKIEADDAVNEQELAKQALDKQRQEIAQEAKQKAEREALKVAEKHRLHLESQAHLKHEDDKKRQEAAKKKAKQERVQQQQEALKKAEQEAQKQALLKQEQQTKVLVPPSNAGQAKPVRKKPVQRPDVRSDRFSKGGRDRKRNKKKGRQQATARNIVLDDNKHKFEKPVVAIAKEITIPETIVVSDLAQKLSIKVADIIKQLMKLGIMATINQSIDQETAVILVEELGHKVIMKNNEDMEKDVLASFDSNEYPSLPRAPIVTIMGHVDHGKTSLLDYIRKTRVAESEAGGITQHIGAYQVVTDHGSVTFLDTPGHAAFTAMRARGAQVTDIVIVVVAADDGVMPQTKEAIKHSKAAAVPMIVAINKVDKSQADPQRVMQELAAIDVVPEEWGGNTQFIEVSAKTGQGVNDLIEALILQAEILELQVSNEGMATGFVIEAKLDKGRGPVATVLVQKGTLHKGEIVLCGHQFGRIRTMYNENAKLVNATGPSTPVEIVGLSGTPIAGEKFHVIPSERQARELAEHRADKFKSSRLATRQVTKLDEVFSKMATDETVTLNLVIKTDVQGSLEALRDSLIKLSADEVQVKVVYGGVGGINESDANLALVSNAIVIGFNVRADATARKLIAEKNIDLHYYSIIYDAIDEVKKSISGLLSPDIKEQIVGIAEVRDVFRSPKFGSIAGCMVIDGQVKRSLPIRVLRDNIVIYEGQLESLRRFKDDIAEVKLGMECGIGVKNYNDVKINDQIEVFERIEIQRKI